MLRAVLSGLVSGLSLLGCRQLLGFENAVILDAGVADTSIDIPTSCETVGTSCVGSTVVECATVGATPTLSDCAWGCLGNTDAHCATLVPGGGAAVGADVDPMTLAALGEVEIAGSIDTNTGAIAGSSIPVVFRTTATASIFLFKKLTVNGALTATGTRALVLISNDEIVISATINMRGCGNPQTPGPGGFPGGFTGAGSGPGGGASSAGGGYGGTGGDRQGAVGTGGDPSGDPELSMLVGGSGGGGGTGLGAGRGGGGGGAIQLISNTRITIVAAGGINAGGCGGEGGFSSSTGGGGGAGGAILLQAPKIEISGPLAVNGGGGGGSFSGLVGEDGRLSRVQANGGGGSGAGGDGGAGTAIDGDDGGAGSLAGAGGGGLGRIRFETKNSQATIDSLKISPALDDPNTTCTLGTATTL